MKQMGEVGKPAGRVTAVATAARARCAVQAEQEGLRRRVTELTRALEESQARHEPPAGRHESDCHTHTVLTRAGLCLGSRRATQPSPRASSS
eukprot:COSAG01_NODE_12026_length_1813_cov_3.278880_2_plen_92_part_00